METFQGLSKGPSISKVGHNDWVEWLDGTNILINQNVEDIISEFKQHTWATENNPKIFTTVEYLPRPEEYTAFLKSLIALFTIGGLVYNDQESKTFSILLPSIFSFYSMIRSFYRDSTSLEVTWKVQMIALVQSVMRMTDVEERYFARSELAYSTCVKSNSAIQISPDAFLDLGVYKFIPVWERYTIRNKAKVAFTDFSRGRNGYINVPLIVFEFKISNEDDRQIVFSMAAAQSMLKRLNIMDIKIFGVWRFSKEE